MNLYLSYDAQTPATEALTVDFTKQPGGAPAPDTQWTLTAPVGWPTLSLNASGSGASTSLSGKGTQTV